MSLTDELARAMGQERKPSHTYIINLATGMAVKVRADFFSIDSNGVLSLGLIAKYDILAYAPGAWMAIVEEGIEMEGKPL